LRAPADRYAFHAMGCEIVVAGASRSRRIEIERLFARRDQRFSRFRSGSELSQVNAAAGEPVYVSREFAAMLALALDAAQQTAGLVDPTLGAALERAGYDADFASLRPDRRLPVPDVRVPRASPQLTGRVVTVPRGVRLDLNGVVKGQTVDDAVGLLEGNGFVSAGGDIAVRGAVVAGLPRGGAVSLLGGALATSGVDRRRWLRGGEVQHHLIDPSTGVPSRSPWEQVTVCGGTCLAADIAAKAAFLLGAAGPAWLDARGLPGRFIGHDGQIVPNRRWRLGVEASACT
jgi:FAD:protein FMN transferase